MSKQKVLIIDDEPDIRELLEITLGRMNLETQSVADLSSARQQLVREGFDLCLADMRLPDGDGIDLVKEIQDRHPDTPVAVITAHGSTETAISALKSGAFDFISKPVDLDKLRSLVSTALKLNADNSSATSVDTQIIGDSDTIKTLKVQIAKLARSQAPVFISGESGSGKELVARAIHSQGPRKDKPFVAINCGAVPTELMESEFFGHKKGSFSGADQDKEGLFQAAHGGSLFLDEIADLPLHMQVKLLRAIQEKSIRPVGSQKEIPVDVRIISATHKHLAEEVERGNLRRDLYYRINVIELKVPSLRDRKNDIPQLTQHIMEKLARENDGRRVTLSRHAMNQLMQYDFPGNVRELENLLQRAYALADHDVIHELELPETPPSRALECGESKWSDEVQELAESYSLERHLESIEKKAIQAALKECRWNKTEAARKLGMSFRSFRYRVKKLGLD